MLHDFALLPDDADSTLEKLLTVVNGTGATIRALIWDMPALYNSPAHWVIDGLSNGQSILDRQTHHAFNTAVVIGASTLGYVTGNAVGTLGLFGALAGAGASVAVEAHHAGSHHWKCVVLRNAEGPIAHVGGIDINPNRLDGPEHSPDDARYHDVQCRIVGPAVADVMTAFTDRWNDHPDRSGSPLTLDASSSPAGTAMVQIARTYGAGMQSYAPAGDRTIWATLKRAIGRAQKYIYIEDQYLAYAALSTELLTALARIEHLVNCDGWAVRYGCAARCR